MFDWRLIAVLGSSLVRRCFRSIAPAILVSVLTCAAFTARASDGWTITSYPHLANHAQLTQRVSVDNVRFGFSCNQAEILSAYLHTGTGDSVLPTVELQTWTEVEFVVEGERRKIGFLQQPYKDVWLPLRPSEIRTLADWLKSKSEAATLMVAFRDIQGRRRQIHFPGSVSAAIASFQKHCAA